jgi:hypothetical protein
VSCLEGLLACLPSATETTSISHPHGLNTHVDPVLAQAGWESPQAPFTWEQCLVASSLARLEAARPCTMACQHVGH